MAAIDRYYKDPELVVRCKATGTDGNDCTITATNAAPNNVASIVRTAEGKYTVTFTTWGPTLGYFAGQVLTAVDALPKAVKCTTFDSSAGTLLIETWIDATEDVAGAKGDVVSGETLVFTVTFPRP